MSINNEKIAPYGQMRAASPGTTVGAGVGTVPRVKIYKFSGGAASWFGTQILGS